MRRFSFLLLGLTLAVLGVRVVTGAEIFAPYLLRDGLIIGGLGALVFGLNAAGWRAPQPAHRLRALPRLGQTLWLSGLVVALVGGVVAGLGLGGIPGLTAWLSWGIGLALLLAGAWWPGGEVAYTLPPVRWAKDEAGNIVAQANEAGDADALAPVLGRRSVAVWLLVILVVAAVLRFWNLADLPPGCAGNECTDGLRLVEGQPLLGVAADQFGLFTRLARAMVLATGGAGVLSLRLAAALIGWLTVPVFFLAARRLTTPVNALLATALLALSPWHLWAGRSSDPWVVTALLAALALWWSLAALAHANVRWWTLAGLALGLLFVEAPPLRGAVALWAVTMVGLAVAHAWHASAIGVKRWDGLTGLGVAFVLAAPIVVAGAVSGQLWAGAQAGVSLTSNLSTLLGALLRPDAWQTGPFASAGLMVGFTAALAVVGVGALLRHARQPAALSLVVGSVLLLLSGAWVDYAITPPASVLLAALPLLFGLAAVALDRLTGALIETWGPPLVRPSRLAAAAAIVVLLIVGRSTVAFMADLDVVSSSGGDQVETDAARFIARWMQEHPGNETTFVVPQAVYAHPSLRLLAGSALAAGRIQALDLARTLPYASDLPGDLLYLVPIEDSQVLNLLRQLYPKGVAATELDETGKRSLFNRFEVAQSDVLATQVLQMMVFAGPTIGEGSMQVMPVNALDFAWSTHPPVEGVFNAKWTGSLLVPTAGTYDFSVESEAPDAVFSLKLDDMLVLDTGLGVTQQQTPLAQGIYRVAMSYRNGTQPADLRVRWQPPGGEAEILGGAVLHVPALADQGLMGEYYDNSRFDGGAVTQRKDAIVGLNPGLTPPTSVRWQGKMAAPRAGEYLIGTVANGFRQVAIDGQLVVDDAGDAEQDGGLTYAEGLIYLPAGWHALDVHYAPGEGAPAMRLVWQPAGAEPGELTGQYLLPTLGEVGPADVALPPAPPLVDARLGDDRFALSRPSDVWNPGARIAPVNVPPLPLETLWIQGNGCGAGQDQLGAPHGVTFSTDSSQLYVADTANRRIQVYDIDGGYSSTLQSELFEEPVDVAVGSDGVPLVLDAGTQQVLRIGEEGAVEPVPMQTGFYRPRGFGLDAQGNVLVADTGGGRVAVLEPNGVFAGEFGGQGSLLGKGQPVDALAFDDALWVVSAEDGRVWNVATDGSLTAIQPTNTIDGPHMAGLADGRFLVTDPGRATFTLFSAQGEPVGQFGYPGQFALPTGIAATEIGDSIFIAVSDTRQCTLSLWRMAAE